MAIEIGALRALLSLDSAAFEKGAARAVASMSRLQARMARTGDRMQQIGRNMSVAMTGAMAGVTLAATHAANSLVEIGNQAQIAGETAERFKVMSLAARDYGIEQDKLADILKDVNDKFGDFAATGAGPLADFFENIAPKVGVTQKSFESLSSSQALQLYVDSLEKAGLSQQQMTFYMEALASDATALLPILQNGGAGFKAMEERAKELGLTLDRQTIEAARRAQREFSVVSEVMKTQFQSAMASLLPAVTAVAEAFAPMAARIAEAIGALGETFAGLPSGMQTVVIALGAAAAAIGPLLVAIGAMTSAIAAVSAPVALAVSAFGVLGAGAAALGADLGGVFGRVASAAGVLAVAIGARLAIATGVRYVQAARAAVQSTVAMGMALGASNKAAAFLRVSLVRVSVALRAMRAALISTGIGALVVGAGELVFQFGRIVKGAGGFGNALGLLKAIAVEAFDRIVLLASGMGLRVSAAFGELRAAGVRAMAGVVGSVTSAAEVIVDTGIGAAAAFKASFALLPKALGDLMFGAANAVVDGVEGLINAVITRINSFVDSINGVLAMLPEWATGEGISIGKLDPVNLGDVPNPFKGAAEDLRTAATDAFNGAQGMSDFSGAAERLGKTADDIETMAKMTKHAGDFVIALGQEPLESVQALKDAVTGTNDEMDSGTDAAGRLGDALQNLGSDNGPAGKAGKGVKGAGEKSKDAFAPLKNQIKSLSDAMAGAIVQGKSLGEAMRGVFQRMAQDLISSGLQSLMMQVFGLGSSGKGAGNWLGSALNSLFNFPSYAVGTDYHPGGAARINEEGGEIVSLPSGSKVMPADLSRRMAAAAGIGLAAAAMPAAAGSGGLQSLSVRVEVVGARGNQEVREMVQEGVLAGLRQYDEALPDRVATISDDNRLR